jgi:hypothetical protein
MNNRFARSVLIEVLAFSLAASAIFGTIGVARALVVVNNDFNASGEGWQIYDYNGQPLGTEGGDNVFYPVTWESTGGVGNSGYVWGDDSRWRIDTPESPDSILSLIIYRSWVGGQSVDLRNKTVSVYLRGDQLDLKGANCYFWVYTPGTRWHYTARPLTISEGVWGTKETFVLQNDESLWHNSWCAGSNSLDTVLGNATSYGFAFVGFPNGVEVTGKFAMDQFTIVSPEPTTARMLVTGGLTLLAAVWWRSRWGHFERGRTSNTTTASATRLCLEAPQIRGL